MGIFTKTPKRRPVAEIVSGLGTMVTDLEEAQTMALDEQAEAEARIVELQATRKILMNEQGQASAIVGNLRTLLGLDLDGDGEPDDLDRAIATFGAAADVADTQGPDEPGS